MNHDLKRNNTPRKILATEVCLRLLFIWSKAGIPVITERRITMLILESVDCYKNKLKNQENISTSWVSSWKKKLFDIAACKCSKDCSCPENSKIPSRKVKLITDLRQQNKHQIPSAERQLPMIHKNWDFQRNFPAFCTRLPQINEIIAQLLDFSFVCPEGLIFTAN
jgi:hypothetical protein